jgi:hypothetical protein
MGRFALNSFRRSHKGLWCWLTPSLVEQPQQNLTVANDPGLLLTNPGMNKKHDQVL